MRIIVVEIVEDWRASAGRDAAAQVRLKGFVSDDRRFIGVESGHHEGARVDVSVNQSILVGVLQTDRCLTDILTSLRDRQGAGLLDQPR